MAESDFRTLEQSQDPSALTTAAILREIASLKENFEVRFKAIDRATELFESNINRMPTIVDREIKSLRELIESRLTAQEGHLAHLKEDYDSTPRLIETKIKEMTPFYEERILKVSDTMNVRFEAVKEQFSLRDTHVAQAALNVKDQITTALSAAEKSRFESNAAAEKNRTESNAAMAAAAQKSEDSFTKQIGALDSKIDIIMRQVATSMTRQEVEQLVKTVAEQVNGSTGLAVRFENMVARMNGMNDQKQTNTQGNQWMIGVALGAIGLLVGIFFNAVKH